MVTAALDEDDVVRLSPDQVSLLGELLRPDGVRTVQLTTKRGCFSVTLVEAETTATPRAAAAAETLHASSVGEFVTHHPQRAEPMVRQGAQVMPGTVLGLVRTGLVFAPVTLPADDPRPATLTRVLAAPGTLVDYGTPLFELQRH